MARTAGGLGVGLAVVRKLTELHGGKVEARSAGVNQGSEFEVRLPLLSDTEKPSPQHDHRREGQLTAHPKRVLVVDDNTDLAASTSALLDLWGHHARVAHSGREALEIIPTFRPDLILLDIGLPGLDGSEIAKIIRSETENAGTISPFDADDE